MSLKRRYTYKNTLSLEEAMEYVYATGERKEELKNKLEKSRRKILPKFKGNHHKCY